MRKAGGLAAALLFSAAALAQTGAPWSGVPGTARDLAVAPSGEVYAAGVAGNLWRWRAEDAVWVPLPGRAARIAAGPGGSLWAVSAEGAVLRHANGGWETLPGPRVRDLALDAQGEAYVAREDGSLARWNAASHAWVVVPGRGHRVVVASDGALWTLAEDGAIARVAGEQVETVPGRARDLAAGAAGVVAASAEGRLERWEPGSRTWEEVPGAPRDVAQVALAPDGAAWIASAAGAILTQAPVNRGLGGLGAASASGTPEGVTFGRGGMRGGYYGSGGYYGDAYRAARRAAGAAVVLKPPAATTDPAPFEFVDTLGTASRLAIGQDGSVFAIALDGALTRWSNARRAFVAFPGSVVRVAVDAAGNPWGVNQAGRIFRHTGTDWRQVRGTASDLAIAARGPIMAASASGALSVYDASTDGFLPVQGELYFIALEPEGVPWGLLRDGTVLRCAAAPCERVGFDARNIAIGPDGSVFIVNFANELRRFNRATGQFDFIPVPGHVPASVAVGPFGRPWVVTTTGKVLSSRFFERDEDLDLKTAAATVTPTTGTGDAAPVLGTTTASGTGFTFSKAMRFTEVTVPCAVGDDVAVGPEGTVIVRCDGGARLLRYNAAKRNLVDLTGMPTSFIVAVDIDAEGRLWLVDGSVNGRIYRQRAKNSTAWDTLQVTVSSSGIACDIAIGPDGTAYYIDASFTLYRKTAAEAKFSKMINGTYIGVAVGVANDVWVRTSSDLYQIVGGQLEKRPLAGSPSTFDVGGNVDGSIYATQMYPGDSLPRLYKWNAGNRSFDRVTQVGDRVDVAPNGRPWIYTSSQGRLFVAR